MGSARGFANPALQRPHLTRGVEVFASQTSDNAMRYSDPTTSETQAMPSARRGASLTLVDDLTYMFGGRTNGYTCASTYKDTLTLGSPESGRDVTPCAHKTAEVNEMWSFDIHSYKWQFVNTTWMSASLPPPSRELHTSVAIGGAIYVFGGKSRTFSTDVNGNPQFLYHSDVIFGDFWRFNVPQSEAISMSWPQPSEVSNAPLAIPENRRLFLTLDGMSVIGASTANGDGTDARTGKCIEKVVVTVTVTHSCINQLRMSVMGPNPNQGSPNFHDHSAAHEVLLYNQRKTDDTGCASGTHSFVFDESADRFTDTCCTQNYDGSYKPEGRLSEYVGTSMLNEWTLVVQDMKLDSLVGTVVSWDIDFIVSECVPVYSWTNLNNTIDAAGTAAPAARYGHRSIAYGTSLFVFGGRDSDDKSISLSNDLFRFDTLTDTWVSLAPVNFELAMQTSSSVGSNFLLTSWGLLRFGGYFRQPTMPTDYDNYVNDIFMLDPVTLRWRNMEIIEWPQADGMFLYAYVD